MAGNPFFVSPLGGVNLGASVAQGFQLGQQIGQTRRREQLQQQQAQQAQQMQQLRQQALGGDQQALQQIAAFDPQAAQQLQQFQTEGFQRRVQSVVQGAAQAQALPTDEAKLDFLRSRRGQLVAQGVSTEDTDELIGLFEAGQPEQANALIESAVESGERMGIIRPPSLEEEKLEMQRQDLDFRRSQASLKERQQIDAQGQKLLEQEVKQAKTKFDQAAKIRGEVSKSSDEFNKIQSSFDRIQASESTAAGDLALIFNFMKMLDPGSVVREGEFATAQNATGVPERIRNLYDQVVTGERLNPKQRKSFISQGRSILNASQKRHTKRIDDFERLGKRFGLERGDIIITEPPAESEAAPVAAPMTIGRFQVRVK